jgi:RNA polymerase sigma-70 factor (ECF subfamily)
MTREEEKHLVDGIIQGDEKKLFELYRTYKKQLYLFVNRKVSDSALAEDLAQEIFLQFIESLRDFRFQSSLKTFLFTIARNKVIDYFRKKKLKKILFSALPQFVVEGLASVVMDDDLEKKQLQEKIDRTFESLPHDYALVLRLKYIDNKSVKHIAEVLLKTFKSTESLIFRARKAFIEAYQSSEQ